jgi:hypothetical protein
MSARFALLRSLDPYHQRVGYLNGVLLSAIRGLDSREALVARFFDLMFERVYEDEARWADLFGRIPQQYHRELRIEAKKAQQEDPTSILIRNKAAQGWIYIHELWRHGNDVYSKLGPIKSEATKVDRPIELAKWLELILPTYELSEDGYVIRTILEDQKTQLGSNFNPLRVRGIPPLELLYTRSFLNADCLFPILVCEMVKRSPQGLLATRGENGLLRAAVEALLLTAGTPSRPDQILEFQDILEFRDSVTKSLSTEENYLRPRMEILVDLGIVDRKQNSKASEFPWIVTDITRRAAEEWEGLTNFTETSTNYLERRFFASMAKIFGRDCTTIKSSHEILLAFADSFAQVGREFGFTPARTIALFACIRASEKNQIIELPEMLSVVTEAAKTNFGNYLHFSGGSRFDNEFLIRVDPGLRQELAKVVLSA